MRISYSYILSLMLMLITSATSAVEFFEDENVYWYQGRNIYFKYAEQDSSKTGKNDHPANLDDKQIRAALQSLEIWEKDALELNEPLEPVFTIKQTAIIGQQLASGLKKAKSDQDILFALDKKEEKLFGLKTKVSYVAGRAFVKDGMLNIIIGDYNRPRLEGYEKAYDPTDLGIVAYPFLHGRRSEQEGTFDVNTIKVDGIENMVVNKRMRKDWFVIDVKTASDTFLALKKQRENPKSSTDKKFEAEAAKLAREQREMRLEMARMRKEMKEGGGNGSEAAALTAEERLENLDKLYNKGLISDEEYAEKRKEILSDL